MKILLISTCKHKLHEEEFVKPIVQILKKEKKEFEIQHYTKLSNLEEYSHIIICGTALKDNAYIKYNFDWIKEFKKPILGICAGSQIIAKVFDEKILDGQEIGAVQVKKIKEDKIIENINLNEIYCLHNKYSRVPKGFNLILKTTHPQLFRNYNVICCLFHPEVRNENIILNFLNI